MSWVLERLGAVGEGAFRGSVYGGWGLHVEALVRSFGVEDKSALMEGALLGTEVRLGDQCGLPLQVSVHALVPGVLLRFTWLDELEGDAQLDPPDRELREASDGGGREGMPVVRPNAQGESELAEEMAEAPNGEL